MSLDLPSEQLADLSRVVAQSRALGAEVVLIGAMAFRHHFPREHRHTSDIDLAIALDLDDFETLGDRLMDDDWQRTSPTGHRWRSANGTLLDLLPAGPRLREAKRVVWPGTGAPMSLIGFSHVFAHSLPLEISATSSARTIDVPTLLLIKMVAFMDGPDRRLKDLSDIRAALTFYESENTDRLFCDEVFEAQLTDIRWASAFLLGLDLGSRVSDEERRLVESFLELVTESGGNGWRHFRDSPTEFGDRTDETARTQLRAFERGLSMRRR